MGRLRPLIPLVADIEKVSWIVEAAPFLGGNVTRGHSRR